MRNAFIIFLFLPLLTFAADFSVPRFLDNQNSKFTPTDSKSRVESHIYLSFIIDEQGKAQDIIAVNQSPFKDVYGIAKRYISNYRFAPAMKNGKPVSVEKRMFWRYDKSLMGSNNDGVSVSFGKRYEKLKAAIIKQEYDTAADLLEELKSSVKNLDEQAHYAWLSARYFAHTSQWDDYAQSTLFAWALRRNLPNKYAYIATKNMFELALHQIDYRLAQEVVASLNSIEGIELSREVYRQYIETIQAELDKRPVLNKTYAKEKTEEVYHKLARNEVELSSIETITSLQLRCSNLFRDIGIIKHFAIPTGANNCRLVIRSNGSKALKVIERGSAHLAFI